MIIAITGHTAGIGKAIYETLSVLGHTVVGLSRTNGYDITDYTRIVEKIINSKADIFINNAYAPIYQTKLIDEVYQQWALSNKLILNIGSCAALISSKNPDYHSEYTAEKRAQKDMCTNINRLYRNGSYKNHLCRVTNINLHYVRTEFPTKHNKKLHPNLEPNEVAELINLIINQFKNKLTIEEMTVHSTRRPPNETI